MKKYVYVTIIIALVLGCGKEDVSFKKDSPLLPPNLLKPTNKKLCVANKVFFSWQKNFDNKTKEESYILEISKEQNFQSKEYSITQKQTKKIVTLEKGVLYFWRVKTVDSSDKSSDYSTVYQFYTEGEASKNHFPFAPVLVSPKLDEKVSSEIITLSWKTTDLDKDPLTHTVYFGSENPPKEKKETAISNTSIQVKLNKSTTYFWRVDVKDSKGAITKGQVWSFSRR